MKTIIALSVVLLATLTLSACGFSSQTCVEGPLGNGGCINGGIGITRDAN